MSRTSRWLLALAGFLAGCLLLLTVSPLFLEEQHYKRLAAWAADVFLDSRLEITSPFRFSWEEGLRVSAGGLLLEANDQGFALKGDALDAHFRLPTRRNRALWVENLQLASLHVRINEEAKDDSFDLYEIDLPPVILSRVAIGQLYVEYQEMAPGTLHRLSLESLIIDDVNDAGPVMLSARGHLEGHAFTMEGRLPPIATIMQDDTEKPVHFSMQSGFGRILLDGTVRDPVNGDGLDIAVSADLEGIQQIAELFDDNIPVLGDLSASLRLVGSYASPGLEDIDIRLQRGESVRLAIRGEVRDPLNRDGIRLSLQGKSDNPQVTSWLLFRNQDRLANMMLNTDLRMEQGRVFIDRLESEATTTLGLKLAVAGSGELLPAGSRLERSGAGFDASIEAPRTDALNIMRDDVFPELGPVSGRAKVVIAKDAVGLFDARIDVGSESITRAGLVGDLARIPLQSGAVPSGMDMAVDVQARSLETLGRQFGFKWPALGETRLKGSLGIDAGILKLTDARLLVGAPDQPTIRATGSASKQLHAGSSIDMQVELAVTDLVAAFSDHRPGYLGRLKGGAKVSDIDGSWGIEDFSLASARTSLYRLKMNGAYDDALQGNRASIDFSLEVDDPEALGKALYVDLPGRSPFRARGRLTADRETLSYRGEGALGKTRSRTKLDGRLVQGKPVLTGSFVIPVLHLSDIGLERKETSDMESLSTADGTAGPKRRHVFGRDPINLDYLDRFNLDFDFDIEQIESRELTMEGVTAKLRVLNGALSLSPARLDFEGGSVDLDFEIRNEALPRYVLKMTADDVKLGPLMSQVQGQVPITGYSNLLADLEARGTSPHELASSVNGEFSFGLENARIPSHYLDLLSVDTFGWVFSQTFAQRRHADLNCVLMAFDADRGKLASRAIIADGPNLGLGGKINMDLGAETLDIVLVPKQKKRVFSTITPVKIRGSMLEPRVEAMPTAAAVKEIGGLALLPGVFIPVRLLEKLWSIVDDGDTVGAGCASLRELNEAAEDELQKRQ